MSQIKSPARLKVIDFIKSDKNTEFVFVLKDFNETEARNFVHSMRVELSRLRKLALERYNRVPKPFKMQLLKVEASNGNCTVTLMKVANLQTEVAEEIDEILDAVAGGQVING
jgi:hypothetical protein